MEKNEIEIENVDEISKIEYIFFDNEQTIQEGKSKSRAITPEMIKYELVMEKGEDDTIIITITCKNQFLISQYQVYLNIQNFLNLSPYFKLLYKINPIFCIDNYYSIIKSKLENSIINLSLQNNNTNRNIINLQNSKIKFSYLKSDDNNTIYLIFDINYVNLKTEEIKIELKKIESIEDEDLINIYQILLRNKYNYIHHINYLENKLNKTQTSLEKYQELLYKCNSYFDHDMQLKMSFLDYGLDTDILESPDDYSFIVNILSNSFNTTNISFEQIYKASCFGDNTEAFHNKCDDIQNTLILIITDDKRRFGGFTSVEWDKSNRYKFDDKAFLFSLDFGEVYYILDEYKDKAINCRESFYAPIFGNDLFIFDGFFSSKLNKAEEKYFDYSKSQMANEKFKLSGQKYFTITEMEVYKIIYV